MLSSQRINHKGFELGLKTIFTSIAGAIILLFFIKFAYDQQTLQENITTRTTLNDLNDYLDALSIGSSTSRSINLPEEISLDADCESLHLNDYQKKDHKIIYTKPMTTKNINTWVQPWNYPYKITSFYYLDNNERYVLIYSQETKDYVTNLNIPNIIDIQQQPINQFLPQRIQQEQQGKPVTLVFFTTTIPPGVAQIKNAAIIKIDLEQEEVVINNLRQPYLGEAMMLGAIFGKDTYACNQATALEELRRITTIYEQKTRLLQLKTTDTCRNLLNLAQQTLSNYKTATILALPALQEKIEEQNRELTNYDCPTIY